jgi:CHAT domain-containing protein
MEEFYTNLWQHRLPKLEALRRAQIAILGRYDPDKQALRPEAEAVRRVPPHFWAAFTLSGDWR